MEEGALDFRPAYVIGDLVANVALGAVVGLLCWLLVGPAWDMWIAMLLMMAVGNLAGIAGLFVVGRWLGALEAMVPLMFTGELTGMVVGMAVPMMSFTASQALIWGAGCGAVAMAIIWLANAMLSGVTREGETGHG